jgi:hypothetical protein
VDEALQTVTNTKPARASCTTSAAAVASATALCR